ncbi:MAG: STAS domain-containing protein [Acidobacteriota bacterium]
MDLEIKQRDKDGIRILDLWGRLVIGPSEATLREVVFALAKGGIVNAILNFDAVKELDEDGLGALDWCAARLRESAGALKLVNLGRVHIELIVLMRMDTAFDVFRNEQDAVDSFYPDRAERRFDLLKFVEEHQNHPRSTPSD